MEIIFAEGINKVSKDGSIVGGVCRERLCRSDGLYSLARTWMGGQNVAMPKEPDMRCYGHWTIYWLPPSGNACVVGARYYEAYFSFLRALRCRISFGTDQFRTNDIDLML